MLRQLKDVVLGNNELILLERGWGYDVAKSTKTQKFFYKSDVYDVSGFVSYPKEIDKKLPIIIWNRGGNNNNGLLDDFLASGILGEIASWGYIVFASQYRNNDEFGGKDVNDVLNLLEEAKKFEFSDDEKIGMEGWSRGGMMSYLTLTKSNEIGCCTVVAGLSNLVRNNKYNPGLSNVFGRYFGSKNENEFTRKLIDRSAVYWAEKINSNTKILFIHGTADEKILVDDSIEMYDKLSEINKNTGYEINLFKGGDHFLRRDRKEVSVLRKSWFEKNLKSVI